MPATEAMIGYLSKFSVWDADASPPSFVELGEIKDITPPSDTFDIIEATHMQSPNSTKEFVLGLIDPGEASMTLNWIPGGDTDDRLRTIKAAREAVQCRIEYPNGATHTFNALLTTMTPAVPVQDIMTCDVSWKVTGPVTPAGPASP